MPKALLPLTGCAVGFCIMGLEMALARQAAPHVGASLPVWAVLISWVLLAATLGYTLGGALSLRYPARTSLPWCLCIAATATAVLALVGPVLLRTLAAIVSGGSPIGAAASLLGLMVLTGVPILANGAVVPISVRQSVESTEKSGLASGRLQAWATIGSLLGTLLTALLLLPWLGVRCSLLLLAVVNLAPAGFLRRAAASGIPVLIVLMLAPMPDTTPLARAGTLLHEGDSQYHHIQAIALSSGRRELRVNNGYSVQSVYEPNGPSRGGSWSAFLLAQYLRADCDTPPASALILGLAAGTMARDLRFAFPGVTVDGVEVDAELVRLGRQFFALPADAVVATGDARIYLARQAGKRWDFLFLDAYSDLYLPFHLTTREFFLLAHDHLAPGGVLATNVVAWPGNQGLLDSVASTLQSVFSRVAELRLPGSPNVILFAHDSSNEWIEDDARLGQWLTTCNPPRHPAQQALVRRLLPSLKQHRNVSVDPPAVLTDDRAPVEWLTHLLVWTALKDGLRYPSRERGPNGL